MDFSRCHFILPNDPSNETIASCFTELNLSVIDARFVELKSSPTGSLMTLPPCESSLRIQIMRSAYQSGCIWGWTVGSHDHNIEEADQLMIATKIIWVLAIHH